MALTTYERDGYKTALQEVEYWEEVEWTPVPRNVVNAPLKPWDVPVVDDVVFTEEELNASMEKHPAERYSKAGHLFNLHSWAPLYYSPDRLMENSTLDAQFGATLISQNLLGTTEASLGYGYTLDGHSTVRGRFAYYGWAPKIEVTALWSDHPHQTINTASSPFYTSYYKGNSFDLSVRAYLPLLLSSGYRIRSLVPTLQFNLDNTEIITPEAVEPGIARTRLRTVQRIRPQGPPRPAAALGLYAPCQHGQQSVQQAVRHRMERVRTRLHPRSLPSPRPDARRSLPADYRRLPHDKRHRFPAPRI